MLNYHLPLVEDQFYHIFNRGNSSEKIFFKEKTITIFLKNMMSICLPISILMRLL